MRFWEEITSKRKRESKSKSVMEGKVAGIAKEINLLTYIAIQCIVSLC